MNKNVDSLIKHTLNFNDITTQYTRTHYLKHTIFLLCDEITIIINRKNTDIDWEDIPPIQLPNNFDKTIKNNLLSLFHHYCRVYNETIYKLIIINDGNHNNILGMWDGRYIRGDYKVHRIISTYEPIAQYYKYISTFPIANYIVE